MTDNFMSSQVFLSIFFAPWVLNQLLNSLYTPVLMNDLISQRNSSLLLFLDVDHLLYVSILIFCQRIWRFLACFAVFLSNDHFFSGSNSDIEETSLY